MVEITFEKNPNRMNPIRFFLANIRFQKSQNLYIEDVSCAMLRKGNGRVRAFDTTIDEGTLWSGWSFVIDSLCDLIGRN